MTEHPGEGTKDLEEVLRDLLERAVRGEARPVFVGIQVIIPPPGHGPAPPVRDGPAEPSIEVQRLGDRVVLAAGLPGVSAGDISVLFRGDRVFIWARDQDRQYRASARVPPAVEGSQDVSYRNGVLEVSYVPE
jgi:hypothetical protein